MPLSGFNELKWLLSNTSGQYISKIKDVVAYKDDYVIYIYNCEFEKEEVVVTISFNKNISMVEGLFFNSQNLRKAAREEELLEEKKV